MRCVFLLTLPTRSGAKRNAAARRGNPHPTSPHLWSLHGSSVLENPAFPCGWSENSHAMPPKEQITLRSSGHAIINLFQLMCPFPHSGSILCCTSLFVVHQYAGKQKDPLGLCCTQINKLLWTFLCLASWLASTSRREFSHAHHKNIWWLGWRLVIEMECNRKSFKSNSSHTGCTFSANVKHYLKNLNAPLIWGHLQCTTEVADHIGLQLSYCNKSVPGDIFVLSFWCLLCYTSLFMRLIQALHC